MLGEKIGTGASADVYAWGEHDDLRARLRSWVVLMAALALPEVPPEQRGAIAALARGQRRAIAWHCLPLSGRTWEDGPQRW